MTWVWPVQEPWAEVLVTFVVAYPPQQVNSYPTVVVAAHPSWTMTVELLTRVDWLLACGCIHVAIKSTGDDWEPVFNILSGTCEVLLVDAQYGQAVPWWKSNKHRICMHFQRSLVW
jgi:hypothetical protein